MRKKPTCTQRTVIAKSTLFTVEQMDLQFSNGAKRVYERIVSHGHGAVLVVPISASGSLYLVEEYAAGIDTYTLAFPKGAIEKHESSEAAAGREIREEIGMAAGKLTWLKTMTLSPGYFGASMELWVAQNLYPAPLPGDEPEPLKIVEWPLHDWKKLLYRPDFSESRSIAALCLVKDWLQEENDHE